MPMSVVYTTVNGQILRENRGGVVSHFVSDPLGSVVMVRDASGNTVYEAEYDPYGNVQSETGTNPFEFGYVGTLGYVKDSAFSLYVRARYLLTNLGRWQTKDPLWPNESGFVYAGAMPTTEIDYYGERPLGGPKPLPPNTPCNCPSRGKLFQSTNVRYGTPTRESCGQKKMFVHADSSITIVPFGLDGKRGTEITCDCTTYKIPVHKIRATYECVCSGCPGQPCRSSTTSCRWKLLHTLNCKGIQQRTEVNCFGRIIVLSNFFYPYSDQPRECRSFSNGGGGSLIEIDEAIGRGVRK